MATYERKLAAIANLQTEKPDHDLAQAAVRDIRALTAALRAGRRDEARKLLNAAANELRELMAYSRSGGESGFRHQLGVRT